MRAFAAPPLSAGGDSNQGRQSASAGLSGEALVWALSALAEALRIAFEEKPVLGQSAHLLDTIKQAARRLGLQSEWASRHASGLRKLAAPFLVLLQQVSREPPHISGIDRESLASFDAGASLRIGPARGLA